MASFQVDDKNKMSQCYTEIFLLTNLSIDIILGMFFLTLSNVEINFVNWDFNWRLYIATKALLIMR